MFTDAYVDLFNVSAGVMEDLYTCIIMHPSMFLPQACNAYLAAFCEKHGYDYEPDAWVGDDPGGIAEVGDLFVSMADMLTDIDRDAPKEEYIKYYDYCMRVGGICDGKLNTPNYDSWLRGCPRMDEEQIARLEELQRDVRSAEMNLKVEIDRINNLKQE